MVPLSNHDMNIKNSRRGGVGISFSRSRSFGRIRFSGEFGGSRCGFETVLGIFRAEIHLHREIPNINHQDLRPLPNKSLTDNMQLHPN